MSCLSHSGEQRFTVTPAGMRLLRTEGGCEFVHVDVCETIPVLKIVINRVDCFSFRSIMPNSIVIIMRQI